MTEYKPSQSRCYCGSVSRRFTWLNELSHGVPRSSRNTATRPTRTSFCSVRKFGRTQPTTRSSTNSSRCFASETPSVSPRYSPHQRYARRSIGWIWPSGGCFSISLCPFFRRMVSSGSTHREFSSLHKAWNTRLDADLYSQRCPNETVNSRLKRKYGAFVRSRRWWKQFRELALGCITYNLDQTL